VDELAFGGNGLGARTKFSGTSGILGVVISAFAFAFSTAGTVGAVTSGSDRENKWLTTKNQNY
jgi:hypothetical protein